MYRSINNFLNSFCSIHTSNLFLSMQITSKFVQNVNNKKHKQSFSGVHALVVNSFST